MCFELGILWEILCESKCLMELWQQPFLPICVQFKVSEGDPVLYSTHTESCQLFGRGCGRGSGGHQNLADTDTDEQTAMELTAGMHCPKKGEIVRQKMIPVHIGFM